MTDERKPETPGMSEVSPKFADEAEATVATETSTDEALSALWQEWQHLWEANKKAVEEAQDDKLADETFTALMAVEKRMEDMPARTAAGVWNKLQVAGVWIDTNCGSPDEDKMGVVERLTLSVLADLEWLAGNHVEPVHTKAQEVASAERERITALWGAYKETGAVLVERDGEHQESGTADADDAVTEAMKADKAAWEALVNERCHTLSGLLVKMSAFKSAVAESDFEGPPEVLFDAIVRDLERLSQGVTAVTSQAAAKTEPSGDDDATSKVMEHVKAAAKQGNERAQVMLDEASDWREMIFVTIQDDKAVIQWPPVEVTGRDNVLASAFEETIGTQCAMDVIGHVRSHSKNYDGGRLMEVVEKIMKHGEWGHSEIGFFTALGDFISWGYIRAGDFHAFPDDAEPAARGTAGGSTA